MASDVAEVRAPSWGVIAVRVAVMVWVAAATVLAAALAVPRRAVRRRTRYRGAHAQGRVVA